MSELQTIALRQSDIQEKGLWLNVTNSVFMKYLTPGIAFDRFRQQHQGGATATHDALLSAVGKLQRRLATRQAVLGHRQRRPTHQRGRLEPQQWRHLQPVGAAQFLEQQRRGRVVDALVRTRPAQFDQPRRCEATEGYERGRCDKSRAAA